jgi:hypothetical protein
VIPSHEWGGRWGRIGARPLLVGRSGWAILMSQPSHDTAPRDMSESGAARMLVDDAPDDACLMSARGLIEALAPSLGESCTVCDDEGERPCPCCKGTTTLACHNPACTEAHVCEACDVSGRMRCQCRPSDSVVAVIRGARFGTGMMLPLRRLLAVVDPDAPVSVWTAVGVPLADGRGSGTALVVDIDGTRYALAERIHGEEDELHEVTL